ncbi:Hpt domain-containing protein [Phenylobacterium sp.]|jgi:HPt (histidine-containing phosphotransfer) domain-containing protein|uniref:Hpt domain-containing protein n=1 Tax=Phenylobacterium sp. TaxID=1871053 RepID=UPI002F946E88
MSDPLASLKARFVVRAQDDLTVLETADVEAASDVIHRLAGTAGTLGYHELSRLAAVVDQALHDGQAAPPGALEALNAELRAVIRRG